MKDAIYIPAYSDGLMTLLEKSDNDIKEDYQTDFDEKKSLRIYKKDNDSYFKNFFMLISAGTSHKRENFRKSQKDICQITMIYFENLYFNVVKIEIKK